MIDRLKVSQVSTACNVVVDPDPFMSRDSGRRGMLLHSLKATAETTASLFVKCSQNNRLVY